MARIRTVKPSYFKHADLYDAETESGFPLRVAYAGLWTCCDREGRFKWRPRELKLDILPYDICPFESVLDALEKYGFIKKFSRDGEEFGFVPTFLEHQAINQRESASTIPDPNDPNSHVHTRENQGFGCESRRIPEDIKNQVLARDNACVRCGSIENPHIDHIFPFSIGGTSILTNLRRLCESCNCARPTGGPALIDDLAKDGFTLDDMPRICMHVQGDDAHVGKGREGKGKEGEMEGKGRETPPPDSGSELMLAGWIFEEACLPADNATRRVVADCIRLLVKQDGGTTQNAAEFILAAVKQGIADGDTISRFWFSDRKYLPQKPKKSARQKRIEEWEPSE